jgi:hypothetical protein
MKDEFPEPIHESYRRHRRQRATQIILPIVVAALLFVATVLLVIIATVSGTGNVGRWAAVSTIWISIPTCLMGLVLLALFSGLVYLMAQLLGVAPRYTIQAQNFVHKLAIRIRRVADMLLKPIFAVNGFGATIKALLGRK